MSQIAPCVTAENAEDYKAQMEKIAPFAERIHVDISDGEFAPRFLVGASELWWPENIKADVHAMVARPAEHAQALVNLRPNLIIFHAEAQGDILSLMQQIKGLGIKAGISLLRKTVPETVAPLIEAADHVMIFSGELGQFGGKASLMQLEKIRLVKRINASVEIGWDGGVSVDNAYNLTQGGVQVLNAGGAIQKSADPAATYQELVKEINKQSVI